MDSNTNNLYNQQIYTIDDVLSKEECQEIINRANIKGWNESSPSGGGHGRTGREDPRTNSFCVFNDEILAFKIWNKIKATLPENLYFLGDNIYFNSQEKEENGYHLLSMKK